jgi:hypothetical protein
MFTEAGNDAVSAAIWTVLEDKKAKIERSDDEEVARELVYMIQEKVTEMGKGQVNQGYSYHVDDDGTVHMFTGFDEVSDTAVRERIFETVFDYIKEIK